ncbi:MAG: tetratricopeptide repeat protein, partial [Thermodesulfobacteriota bacterium]
GDHKLLKNYKLYLPYFFIIAIYMGLRINALGGLTAKSNIEIITLNNYHILINIFPIFFQYIKKLFFPVNLSAYYFFHPAYSIAEAKVLWGLLFTTIFVIILCLLKKKDRRLPFFCLSFILLSLLPTFYLRGLAGYAFAERYLYLPSVGFVVLVSYLFKHGYRSLISKRNNRKWAIWCFGTFLSLIIISYSLATILRNPAWQNDYTLWKDVVQKSPDNPAAHYSLGTIYKDRGKITEAIKEYKTVLKLSSVYTKVKAHNNLGNIYSEEGRLDQAIYHFTKAIEINPVDAFTHNNLGLVYTRKGVLAEGITEYLKALQIKPDYPEAHYNLGLVYYENGMPDQAIAEFKKALEVSTELNLTNPAHLAAIHKNLGIVYASKGLFDKSAIQFEKALTITSDDADLHNRLGVIYAGKGTLNKAVAHFQNAVRINPKHKGAQNNLKRVIIMKQKSNTSNQFP